MSCLAFGPLFADVSVDASLTLRLRALHARAGIATCAGLVPNASANSGGKQKSVNSRSYGAPGGTRTHDPRLRRPVLYPAELRARRRAIRSMVGARGFEPPTLCSQSRCSTRLSYAPTQSPPGGRLGIVAASRDAAMRLPRDRSSARRDARSARLGHYCHSESVLSKPLRIS